ncbi:MAG: VWA domain-containing protein [Anaerolineae bacterium]|nr:VWA domain-containing protein [Anaerolineae bacterium]
MHFLAPLGFLALLLAAPIVLLYMLRLRRQNVTVPSILLWKAVLADRHANRPWQKLRRNWLLFLQLLILLTLAVALARPAVPTPVTLRGQVILLLDVSASMQAELDHGTRFDAALRAVRELADTLSPADRVSLIAVGPTPRLLLQGGDEGDLRRALDELAAGRIGAVDVRIPFDGPADWRGAAALAAGLAAGDDVTTLIVTDAATDTALPALPGEAQLLTIGDSVANVGIVAFALRRTAEGMAALVRLRNAGPEATRTVTLYADDVPVERRTLLLPEDGDVALTFPSVSVAGWAEVRLEESDAFALDNRAWVALSNVGSGRVLLLTPGNRFLAQSLQVLPDLSVTQAALSEPQSAITETTQPYDLLVVDGPVTTTLLPVNQWLIAPGPGTLCGEPGALVTPTLGVRGQWSHALLQYVEWEDIHISRMRRFTPPADAEVLLETATGPLLWVVERPAQRVACLAFDLHDSDFPLRLAFPILTANLVGWLLPQTSVEPVLPLPSGYPWVPLLPSSATKATLITPDGDREALSLDAPQVTLSAAGLYRIESGTEGGGVASQFVALALLNAAESDLRARDVSVAGKVISPVVGETAGWRDVSRWPIALALILLLVEAVWWWRPTFRRRASENRSPAARFWPVLAGFWRRSVARLSFAHILRFLLLAALLLALLGVRWSRRTRDLSLVFLLDRSASTRSAWDAQVAFVNESLSRKAAGDRAAIVVFGSDAWVDHPMAPLDELASVATLPRADATDIEEAVRLGVALIPDGAPGRLVLLSDGLETSGKAAWALREAGARNVELLVAQSGSGAPGAEVWVSDLQLPARVYPGDRVPVAVEVRGNTSQPVVLAWSAAGQSGQGSLDLVEGSGTWLQASWAFSFEATEAGFVPLRVCLDASEDTFVQNNCADGWVLVEGTPRVLVVGTPENRQALVQALEQSGLNVETVLPGEFPLAVQGLLGYAGVVVVNTPARDFSSQSLVALRDFVRDVGGGLVAVGGPESYGVGGWSNTPLEEALPVEMRVQDPERFPPMAMVVVIDKSGSMSANEGGVAKIQLAAEAAIRVAEMLNDADILAVVAYDDRPADTYGPVPMAQREALISSLRRLQAGGGGIYVRESLQYADSLLQRAELSPDVQRHVLLLADGSDSEHQEDVISMVSEWVKSGTTFSAVSIGNGSDVEFLRRVAGTGQGRFYLTELAADLPAIFSEETARAKRSYIVEETFYPLPVSSWAPVASLAAVPPLHGYVASTPKSTAQVVWRASQQDPLLAVWQFGLGRSVAWTSDATGQWAAGWVSWDEFSRFWGAVVRDVLLSPSDAGLALRVIPQGNRGHILVDVLAAEGGYADGLLLGAQIAEPGANTEPQTVPLYQTAPGRYEGEFEATAQRGVALLRLYGDRTLVAGWAPPASEEYVPGDAAAAVAQLAAQGGGQVIADTTGVFAHTLRGRESGQLLAPWLLLLAVCMWPVDIAWRRLSLSRADVLRVIAIVQAWIRRRRVAPVVTAPESPTLAATVIRRRQPRESQVRRSPPVPGEDGVILSSSPQQLTKPQTPPPVEPQPKPPATETDASDSLAARLKRRLRE